MKTENVIYVVYTLLSLNIILFLFLLGNKIGNKKKKIKDENDKLYYKRIIKGFSTNKMKGIPKLNTRREISLFKLVLLETFDTSDKNQRIKLLEIARESGLIDAEIESIKNGTDSRKAIAAYSLGEMRAIEATEILLENMDTKNKIENMNAKDKELLYIICRALVLVSGVHYLDSIIDVLESKDYTQKSKILDLISIIDEDIYPKMEEYLIGDNYYKKILAFEALSNKKDIRVLPYIEEAIISNDKELKVAGLKACIGTSLLQSKDLLYTIPSLKDDPNWEVRAFLAKALGSNIILDQDSILILKELVEDQNWFVRFNSSESLLNLGEAGIIALSEILSSPDKFAREKSWDILQRELTLYNLYDRIKEYQAQEYILDNISNYENSLKEGALIESQ